MGRKKDLVDNPYLAHCPFCRYTNNATDVELIRIDAANGLIPSWESYAVECQNCFARGPLYQTHASQRSTREREYVQKQARNLAAQAWGRLSAQSIGIAGYSSMASLTRYVMGHYASDEYGTDPLHRRWDGLGDPDKSLDISEQCPFCNAKAGLRFSAFIPRPTVKKIYMRCLTCICYGPPIIEVERRDRDSSVKEAIRLFREPSRLRIEQENIRNEEYKRMLAEQRLLKQQKRGKRTWFDSN